MTVKNLISGFDIEANVDRLKTLAEPFILSGEPFPARLDVWSYRSLKVSIEIPPTTPETLEGIWSRVNLALSMFGGTHVIFSHRAEIDISSSLSTDELNSMASPCLCMYVSSFISVDSKMFPYIVSSDSTQVLWQTPTDEEPPTLELASVRAFLSLSSHTNHFIGSPQLFHQWLLANGYKVTFYEPFNEQNFGYSAIR